MSDRTPAPQGAANGRDTGRRRDAPRDRPRRLRGVRPAHPRHDALDRRDDEGEDRHQKSEQRAISRPGPGLRRHDDERAHPTEDCLGRASAQGHPASARVAAQRRMGKNEGGDHCWIANRSGGKAQIHSGLGIRDPGWRIPRQPRRPRVILLARWAGQDLPSRSRCGLAARGQKILTGASRQQDDEPSPPAPSTPAG